MSDNWLLGEDWAGDWVVMVWCAHCDRSVEPGKHDPMCPHATALLHPQATARPFDRRRVR